MMDRGSAGGEPDVGSIDLSSHLSGRRRRGATRHNEHFQHNAPRFLHTHTHTDSVSACTVFSL